MCAFSKLGRESRLVIFPRLAEARAGGCGEKVETGFFGEGERSLRFKFLGSLGVGGGGGVARRSFRQCVIESLNICSTSGWWVSLRGTCDRRRVMQFFAESCL